MNKDSSQLYLKDIKNFVRLNKAKRNTQTRKN